MTEWKSPLFVLLLLVAATSVAAEGYTRPLSCEQALFEGVLSAEIGPEKVVIHNEANKPVPVSLATYNMFAETIHDQVLFWHDTVEVPAYGVTEVYFEFPECAYQLDVFCGEVLESLEEEGYEGRQIAGEFGDYGNWCTSVPRGLPVEVVMHPNYPKGLDVVVTCENGHDADEFDWYFGDGHIQIFSDHRSVFHTYDEPGTYTIACAAKKGSDKGVGVLEVTVDYADEVPGENPGNETPGNETMPPGNETQPPMNETNPPGNETLPPMNETMPPINETLPPMNETIPPGDGDNGTTPGNETIPPGNGGSNNSNSTPPGSNPGGNQTGNQTQPGSGSGGGSSTSTSSSKRSGNGDSPNIFKDKCDFEWLCDEQEVQAELGAADVNNRRPILEILTEPEPEEIIESSELVSKSTTPPITGGATRATGITTPPWWMFIILIAVLVALVVVGRKVYTAT